MIPDVRPASRDLPAWRWGIYWGCGEGIEWTLFRRNSVGLMIRTENEFFDCNNYAIRICLLFCSIYMCVHMPWWVRHRILFFCWYPIMPRNAGISRVTFYVERGRRYWALLPRWRVGNR